MQISFAADIRIMDLISPTYVNYLLFKLQARILPKERTNTPSSSWEQKTG